jgi:CBS domain-containing protein
VTNVAWDRAPVFGSNAFRKGRDRTMLTLQDLMTPDPESVSPETSIRDAIELLRSRGISGAPVVAGDRVVGVISLVDLIEFAASRPTTAQPEQETGVSVDYWDDVKEWAPGAEEDDPSSFFVELWPDTEESVAGRWSRPDNEQWDVLSEHAVSEVMTRRLCFLGPTETAQAGADYMMRRGIHRVLVMNGSRLLGIVSTMDVVKAVADGRLCDRNSRG